MITEGMGKVIDHGDWHEWFRIWGERLLLFARQQTPCLADAEDVLQEAFVRIWSQREKFPEIEPGLLFTQIRRCAIDFARSRQRRVEREEKYAWEADNLWFHPADASLQGELQEALESLPEEQQEVLILKIWGEQTFEAIGKTLGVSPNTAASRYRYALENLRYKPQFRMNQ